jgi:peptidyl-prolyl cis-trans isomerase C
MLYVPAKLGYGKRGAGGRIPGGATLIFDLELISFQEADGFFWKLGMPSLDEELFLGIKLWMIVLAGLGWIAYSVFFGGSGRGKTVVASHILVKDEALAKKLKEELASGAEFAELAKQHSTCPSGKNSGGNLGLFGPGQMVKEFDAVCWTAPVGEVQGPVKTQFGFHLIKVTDREIPDDWVDKEDKENKEIQKPANVSKGKDKKSN